MTRMEAEEVMIVMEAVGGHQVAADGQVVAAAEEDGWRRRETVIAAEQIPEVAMPLTPVPTPMPPVATRPPPVADGPEEAEVVVVADGVDDQPPIHTGSHTEPTFHREKNNQQAVYSLVFHVPLVLLALDTILCSWSSYLPSRSTTSVLTSPTNQHVFQYQLHYIHITKHLAA